MAGLLSELVTSQQGGLPTGRQQRRGVFGEGLSGVGDPAARAVEVGTALAGYGEAGGGVVPSSAADTCTGFALFRTSNNARQLAL